MTVPSVGNSSFAEIESTLTTRSEVVRERLRNLCNAALSSLFPGDGEWTRGTWSEDDIRLLTAVFELERVSIHSELEKSCLHSSVIAKVLEKIGTGNLFPSPRSQTLLTEMDQHLRLLASALRLYKFHNTSLDHHLHDELYTGINQLTKTFQNARSRRGKSQKVEDGNVAFLLTHCQSLLVSIDSSDSLAKRVSRKFILAVDGALAGFGEQYQDVRKIGLQLAKRKRCQPAWHPEFLQMDDVCYAIFARDIHLRGMSASEMGSLLDDEAEASELLYNSLEEHSQCLALGGRVRGALKKVTGMITQTVQNSGPYEESADYFQYGILDLMYQLSFRIRRQSRKPCFEAFVSAVRLSLDKAHSSAWSLHRKAVDLWNHVNEVGEYDYVLYGKPEDREFVDRWIRQSGDSADIDYSRE